MSRPQAMKPALTRTLSALPEPVKRRLRPLRDGLAPVAVEPRPSLNEIGLMTGTDKASTIHDYLGVYEANLGHFRDRQFKLIEIGVHKGASLAMWETFFPKARIVGVDLGEDCKQYETDRIRIVVGNQGDQALLARLARNHRPLVVIDDGSHRWAHQIDTFRALWPSVRPGGVFIIEDIHTSFGEDYIKTYGQPDRERAYDMAARIAEAVVAGTRADPPKDDFEAYCRGTIESVVMLRHSVIIHKKRHPQPVLGIDSVQSLGEQTWSTELGAPYARVAAELVGATNKKVISAFAELSSQAPVSFPPAWSGVVRDVKVYGNGPASARDIALLAETMNCAWNMRRLYGLYKAEEGRWVVEEEADPVHVPAPPEGKRYVLLKQTWDRNYGHWLIDALPKVGLLAGAVDLADCIFVLNTQTPAMRAVVLDSLALAGIDEDQVMWAGGIGPHVFEEITVLGTTSRHPVTKSRFATSYLRELTSGIEAGPHERIYVSRNGYGRRELVNESEVWGRLEALGYVKVHPEQLSFHDQVALFKGARFVVGNMGAALASLAFSPDDVSVLALATETMQHDYFYDLVCQKEGGRYRGLQGPAVGATPSNDADFEIDLALLEASLTWLHDE